MCNLTYSHWSICSSYAFKYGYFYNLPLFNIGFFTTSGVYHEMSVGTGFYSCLCDVYCCTIQSNRTENIHFIKKAANLFLRVSPSDK